MPKKTGTIPEGEVSNGHWNLMGYKQRMTTKSWKKILLEERDMIIVRGNLIRLRAKSLGYGVVEISIPAEETIKRRKK